MSERALRVLSALGIEGELAGDELRASCPYAAERHEGGTDEHPSWALNVEREVFNCFACGARGGLVTLVRDLAGIQDEAKAERWLARVLGAGENLEDLLTRAQGAEEPLPEPVYDDRVLGQYRGLVHRSVWTRCPSAEVLSLYDVGYDHSTRRVTFPVRDRRGGLRGVVGRATRPDEPKYLPVFPADGFRLHDVLYGEDVVWDRLARRRSKTVVLVEGQVAVLNLRRHGRDAVALMTTRLSESQHRLLADYRRVVVLLDGDAAGREGAARVAADLSHAVPEVLVCWGHDDDPDGWDQETLEEALTYAMSWPKLLLSLRLAKSEGIG